MIMSRGRRYDNEGENIYIRTQGDRVEIQIHSTENAVEYIFICFVLMYNVSTSATFAQAEHQMLKSIGAPTADSDL
jgi:hypothetical protein